MRFKRRDELFANCVSFMIKVRDSLCLGLCRMEVVTTVLDYTDNANDDNEICGSSLAAAIDAARDPVSGVLQFRRKCHSILWSKENLINVALEYLIQQQGSNGEPETARVDSVDYFAWVDADISFSEPDWIPRAIRELSTLANGVGFVQLFDTALLLGPDDKSVDCRTKGFAAQFWRKGLPYKPKSNVDPEYWHPGFAWATTRATLVKLKVGFGCYLPERTLGSGDRHIALSLIGHSGQTVPVSMSQSYKDLMKQHGDLLRGMELRYVPGVTLIHHWHGPLVNRQYVERWAILEKHHFDPQVHMRRRADGLVVWSDAAPITLVDDVRNYFFQRQEDS